VTREYRGPEVAIVVRAKGQYGELIMRPPVTPPIGRIPPAGATSWQLTYHFAPQETAARMSVVSDVGNR